MVGIFIYMGVTISDIRLKNFLKNKHGLDLTYRIDMVTNYHDLPMEFEGSISSPDILRRYLNRFGPMYFIKGKKTTYLIQDREIGWFCVDKRGLQIPLSEVYEEAGIPEYLAMKPNELYELYKPED